MGLKRGNLYVVARGPGEVYFWEIMGKLTEKRQRMWGMIGREGSGV